MIPGKCVGGEKEEDVLGGGDILEDLERRAVRET